MQLRRFAWSWAVPAPVLSAWMACAQSVPAVTGNERVDKLLSQLTLEEKLKLIHGTQEFACVVPRQNSIRRQNGPRS
jgi:beta-glucosidase